MMNNIHSILMVRPSSFRMNSQTASNNYFQKNTHLNDAQVLKKACLEFDNLVSLLLSHGIPVNVFQDDLINDTPDSIFCLLYTSPSPRDRTRSRMPSSA